MQGFLSKYSRKRNLSLFTQILDPLLIIGNSFLQLANFLLLRQRGCFQGVYPFGQARDNLEERDKPALALKIHIFKEKQRIFCFFFSFFLSFFFFCGFSFFSCFSLSWEAPSKPPSKTSNIWKTSSSFLSTLIKQTSNIT